MEGKKHGSDGKRRAWRKLHLAIDTSTHEIVAAELGLSHVTDVEVLPTYLSRHVVKSLRDQAMALMTQGCATKLFVSSKRFRSFRQGKAQPSGSEVIPAT